MVRIIVRFRQPVIVAFGLVTFLAGLALTLAIGYAIMWVMMAVWPDIGGGAR